MSEPHCYEVEVRALLGSEEVANKVRGDVYRMDPNARLAERSLQLNHYFTGGSVKALLESVIHQCLSEEKCQQFELLSSGAKKVSVRARQKDTGVYLVVKATIEDSSSVSGVNHIEFDEKVALPLDALDALILGSGFEYLAKWSREREEFLCRGISVCLDKNAGYGWTATFSKVVHSQEAVEPARAELRAFMKELGVEELSQARLDRMAAFYTAHWQEYYGTEKVFSVA